MTIPLTHAKQILTSLTVFDGCRFLWTADAYWLPSVDWFRNKYAPVVAQTFRRREPAANRRDCNHAVRIALALAGESMAQRNENAAIAIGRTVGGLYSPINDIDPGNPGTMHDTCLIIFDDLEPYFYEPQNGYTTRADAVSMGDFAADFVEL